MHSKTVSSIDVPLEITTEKNMQKKTKIRFASEASSKAHAFQSARHGLRLNELASLVILTSSIHANLAAKSA